MRDFLRSITGQIVVVLSLVGAAFGWLAIHDFKVARSAVKNERVRVEAAGKKLNAKALKARERAVSDPDRVLSKFYRD